MRTRPIAQALVLACLVTPPASRGQQPRTAFHGVGEVVITTGDERAQAILQCAIQEGRPLDELAYAEGSRSLERVKLTVLR